MEKPCVCWSKSISLRVCCTPLGRGRETAASGGQLMAPKLRAPGWNPAPGTWKPTNSLTSVGLSPIKCERELIVSTLQGAGRVSRSTRCVGDRQMPAPFSPPAACKRSVRATFPRGLRVGQNQALFHSEARLPRGHLARFGDTGTLVGLQDKTEDTQVNLNFG